nr:RecName: Full=Toxin To33; AltName: Full=Toxin Tc33 [Tityus obscurus]
ILNRCCNDDN